METHTIVLYGELVRDLKRFLDSHPEGNTRILIFNWMRTNDLVDEANRLERISNNDTTFLLQTDLTHE